MSHEPLIRAIRVSPNQDEPRLVYADWLEEQGDPRADFIRRQCEMASEPPYSADWHDARIASELWLRKHRSAAERAVQYYRGFSMYKPLVGGQVGGDGSSHPLDSVDLGLTLEPVVGELPHTLCLRLHGPPPAKLPLRLPALRHLTLSRGAGTSSVLEDLDVFEHLETLAVAPSGKPRPVPPLPQLSRLDLFGDMPLMAPNLQSLSIAQVQVSSLGGLPLEQLKSVHLRGSNSQAVEYLDHHGAFHKLDQLSIRRTPWPKDVGWEHLERFIDLVPRATALDILRLESGSKATIIARMSPGRLRYVRANGWGPRECDALFRNKAPLVVLELADSYIESAADLTHFCHSLRELALLRCNYGSRFVHELSNTTLSSLTTLSLSKLPSRHAKQLFTGDAFLNLRSLELNSGFDPLDTYRVLLQGANLPELRELRLRDMALPIDLARKLLSSPRLPKLRRLQYGSIKPAYAARLQHEFGERFDNSNSDFVADCGPESTKQRLAKL